MPLQSNIQNILTGRILFLYGLLLLFSASTNVSGNNKQKIDYEPALTKTNPDNIFESNVEPAPEIVITVIVEQDPNGIFWGLRDTITNNLVLDYTYQKIWDFREGFAIVLLNGKFGLIDRTGKEIIRPVYDSPSSQLNCGFIMFEFGYGPKLIFDTTGKSVMPMTSGISGFLPCRNRITYGHSTYHYGMINFNRDTILSFRFTKTYLSPEGFCVASIQDSTGLNSLFGLYDLDGKSVLPHVFEKIGGFYSGRAVVKKNGKYGVIDVTGKELFYTKYSHMDRFHNGYAVVSERHDDGKIRVGIIDKDGNEVVPAIYRSTWTIFCEGLTAMMTQDLKYGFVDTTGKAVTQFKYDKVQSFENGIAQVGIGCCHAGIINLIGEEIISMDFETMNQAYLVKFHNKFIIGSKDSIQYVFDYSGKEIAALHYDRISEFDANDKSFLVSINYKWGVLDSNFQVRIPIKYESLEIIFPNIIAARENNKIGFINQDGKVISPFLYDWIEPFEDIYMKQYANGLAQVGIGEKTGLINGYGKLIIPVKYDKIDDFSNGLAVVKINDKYGFVNAKGKETITAIYDKANPYNGYSAEVTLKEESFQIDISGNRLEYDH